MENQTLILLGIVLTTVSLILLISSIVYFKVKIMSINSLLDDDYGKDQTKE